VKKLINISSLFLYFQDNNSTPFVKLKNHPKIFDFFDQFTDFSSTLLLLPFLSHSFPGLPVQSETSTPFLFFKVY
jgi:hypothetical protein